MITKIKRRWQNLLFGIDLIIILAAIFLSFLIRDQLDLFLSKNIYILTSLILVFLYSIIFYILDAYNIDQTFKSFRFFTQYIFSFFLISIGLAFCFYLWPDLHVRRSILAFQISISFVGLYVWRLFFENFLHTLNPKKKVAFIGDPGLLPEKKDLIKIIQGSKYFTFAGLISTNGEKDLKDKGTVEILGHINNVVQVIKENNLDSIVVEPDQAGKSFEKNILAAKMSGVVLYDVITLYEKLAEKLPIYYLSDYWILFRTFSGMLKGGSYKKIKRFFDYFISFVALVLSSPLLLFTSILIKLTSKGPLFYKQVRVGLNEKNFEIIKFRSMSVEAEKETGAVWAADNDPRVTPVGRIIRRLRIDELPQLWNILRGDMTLIGPRPERPEFVEKLKEDIPYYSLRYVVKPGISGWAQINYGYGASFDDALEKLQYDLYYIKHGSLFLDLKIFLKTIRIIIFLVGSR